MHYVLGKLVSPCGAAGTWVCLTEGWGHPNDAKCPASTSWRDPGEPCCVAQREAAWPGLSLVLMLSHHLAQGRATTWGPVSGTGDLETPLSIERPF